MATVSKLEFYLLVLKPTTVLSATITPAPVDPYMALNYAAGQTGTTTAVGTSGAPIPGNTVVISDSGGTERGRTRLRSWTPGNGSGTAGNLSIAETDDLGPYIASGDSLQVLLEWRLWPITPRLVQDGTEVEFYEDYNKGWQRQTVDWWPIAVAGPPAVAFLSGGTAQVEFIGNRSFALAHGASLTAYLWTAHGSNELTSTSQGTPASPVTFTWTAAGQYLVSLRVTDSNGNQHTAYTWVFVVDPASPTNAYTQFDAYADSFDWERGGGECSFMVHGVADVSQFPREALAVLACRGTQTTATAGWHDRENVLFVGYIVGNSIRQDSLHNTTSFRALTIDGLMKNLSMHAVSLRDEKGPKDWTMAQDITVDRAASFLMLWRSTLASMTPINRMNYSAEIKRQDFGPTNLYNQLQGELVQDAWAQVVSNHQSVLYLTRDYNLMTVAERSAATTRKTLHKGIWLDSLDVEERAEYEQPVRKVKMSGIYYPGNQAQPVPLFSEAPGDVQKAFGREDAPGRLILTTQSDLNTRCGYALARQNYRWPVVRGRFVNDASFTIAPQEVFPAVIEAADNNRGLAWTPDLIPRRLRRTYNFEGGYYTSEVEFEPSVTGPAGVTVIMPVQPPANPTLPTWDPPPLPEWTPPITPLAGAAVAADFGMGVYWTLDKGATWERRVNGLAMGATGTSQLMFYDLIWDPHWFTPQMKGTHDPEEVVLLGCGPGFIVESQDAGKSWMDLTPYISAPPDIYDDSPAPTGTATLTFYQLHADIHAIDTFYALVGWQNATGTYRGWIAKTTDRWATQTWTALPAPPAGDMPAFQDGGFGPDGSGDLTPDGTWRTINSGTVAYGGEPAYYLRITMGNSNRSVSLRNPSITLVTDSVNTPNLRVQLDGVQVVSNYTGEMDFTCCDNILIYSNQSGGTFTVEANIGDLCTMAGQLRPLAMDLDSQDGSRLYVTCWDGTNLQLLVYATDSMTLTRAYNLGYATDAQITARSSWCFPRTPHLPGAVANYGDYVYVAGRLPSGTFSHIGRSVNAGLSFSEIDDPTWTTERVGGFLLEEPLGSTLYAFLNGSLELWRSQNTGTSWGLINTIPFAVEFEGVSRHWGSGADILIGNKDAAGVYRAAWLNSPYTDAWYNANGGAPDELPPPGQSGGIPAIIWI